jgi:hypothetical protein
MRINAGLFEGPPDFYNRIKSWAKYNYTEQVLLRCLSKRKLLMGKNPASNIDEFYSITSLIKYLQQYPIPNIGLKSKVSKVYSLDNIINWKYLTEDEKGSAVDKLKSSGWSDGITVTLDFNPTEKHGGNTVKHSKNINLFLGTNITSIEEYESWIDDIEGICLHEVSHLGQMALRDIKDLSQAGFPSKIQHNKEKDYYNEDAEFYPVLTDEINLFNKFVNKDQYSKLEQEEYFKRFTGLVSGPCNEFFEALKLEPKKYQKAIKEFYKGIEWSDI